MTYSRHTVGKQAASPVTVATDAVTLHQACLDQQLIKTL